MAHTSHELALQAIGPFDLAIAGLQLQIDCPDPFLGFPAVGHIANDRGDAKSVAGEHGAQTDFNRKFVAILV